MTVLKPNHITQEYLKEGGIEVLVKDIKRVERYDMPPFKEFYHRILFKVYMTSGECFEILRETVDANGNFSEYSAVFKTKEVRRGEPNRALEIRKRSGLSQAAFSEAYGIPKRTIENWEAAKREAPEYVLNLLERAVREDFNGGENMKAAEIIKNGYYQAAVELMDDKLREEVHAELAPCTDEEFLTAYMEKHKEKYGEEFTI